MFERFTTQAREVVTAAQEEARELGHRYIGTEHLLLALLGPHRGGGAAVMAGAGLDRERVRASITGLVGPSALGASDAAALRSIGIDLDAIRAKLEQHFGPGALDCEPPVRPRGLFRRRSTSTTAGYRAYSFHPSCQEGAGVVAAGGAAARPQVHRYRAHAARTDPGGRRTRRQDHGRRGHQPERPPPPRRGLDQEGRLNRYSPVGLQQSHR